MANIDPTNRGTLRKNRAKEQKWHADLKGKLNVDGVDRWLDGYLTEFVEEDGSTTRVINLRLGKVVEARQPPAQSYQAGKAHHDDRPPMVRAVMPDGTIKEIDSGLAKQLGLQIAQPTRETTTTFDDDIPF